MTASPANFATAFLPTAHYRAWVRFSGPGPYITPDIHDVGFMSISIKLMGVPGVKLHGARRSSLRTCPAYRRRPSSRQMSTPMRSPDREPAERADFLLPQFPSFACARPHHAISMDQDQSSPLEAPYFSCVPYLLGEGQAMQYSVWPKSNKRTPIPRLPLRPPDDYLRNAMVAALDAKRRRVRLFASNCKPIRS